MCIGQNPLTHLLNQELRQHRAVVNHAIAMRMIRSCPQFPKEIVLSSSADRLRTTAWHDTDVTDYSLSLRTGPQGSLLSKESDGRMMEPIGEVSP